MKKSYLFSEVNVFFERKDKFEFDEIVNQNCQSNPCKYFEQHSLSWLLVDKEFTTPFGF